MDAIVHETNAKIATVEDSVGNELAILEKVVTKIRASEKVEESIINYFEQRDEVLPPIRLRPGSSPTECFLGLSRSTNV